MMVPVDERLPTHKPAVVCKPPDPPDNLASKLNMLRRIISGNQNMTLARAGLVDGVYGKEPTRNLTNYVAGYELGKELVELLEWHELLKQDSEFPENT